MKKFRPLTVLLVLGCTTAFASDSATLARALNDAFTTVYEKVAPSVVVIEAQSTQKAPQGVIFPDGWDSFFRVPPRYRTRPSPLQGSGIILREDGYVVTNYHVIQEASEGSIRVTFQDGTQLPATIVGVDDKTDLAVLRVEKTGLPAAQLADSDKVKVGQFAFALGAPMELPYTFTFGLVSATGRIDLTRYTAYEDYIQTDAAINPGNSGGPLADIDGKVIGVNTLISGISAGLGFAIPSNMVRDITTQLIERGRVSRPWLGIRIEGIEESETLASNFSPVESGVVVQGILFQTPASNSDLQAGDVILQVDGKPVGRAGDVQKAVLKRAVGDTVALQVWRKGTTRTIEIKTAEQPVELVTANNPPQLAPPRPDAPAPPPSTPPSAPTSKNLGFTIQEVPAAQLKNMPPPVPKAALRVTQVESGSPAAVSGLQEGDVIVHINDLPVSSMEDFWKKMKEMDLTRGAALGILRDGQSTFCILKP